MILTPKGLSPLWARLARLSPSRGLVYTEKHEIPIDHKRSISSPAEGVHGAEHPDVPQQIPVPNLDVKQNGVLPSKERERGRGAVQQTTTQGSKGARRAQKDGKNYQTVRPKTPGFLLPPRPPLPVPSPRTANLRKVGRGGRLIPTMYVNAPLERAGVYNNTPPLFSEHTQPKGLTAPRNSTPTPPSPAQSRPARTLQNLPDSIC